MAPEDIRRTFEERQAAVAELRALYDAADEAGRELTGEEQATEARLDAAILEADKAIETGLEAVERDVKAAEARARLADLTERAAATRPETSGSELRSLVRGEAKALDLGASRAWYEGRDLLAGTATDGQELVSQGFYAQLYAYLRESATVLVDGAARTIRTASGNPMEFPYVSSFSSASQFAEAATITESDPQFATLTLDAYKYAFLTQVSSELEQDEEVGLDAFLAQQGGEALGRTLGADLVVGTGSSEPNGVVNTTNANNVTFASNSAITTDELLDIQHGIASPYRRGAVWVVKDSTVKALRKLKDTTNQYLWQPGLTAGSPSTLLGSPVLVDDSMAAIATTAISVVYGNLQRGYIVRLVGSVRVERSADFAFANDLVTWRFVLRADGDIIDANAIVKGTHPV